MRGTPAAPTHRYTPDYFERLETLSDWAKAPSRAALREAHAAASAPLQTNADFRRLLLARSALCEAAVATQPKPSEPLADGTAGGGRSVLMDEQGANQGNPSQVQSSQSAVMDEQGAAPGSAPPTPNPATPGPTSDGDHRAALFRLVGPSVRVRFFVLEETDAAAKALGYYAAAWRCRAVVGGRPFDGGLRKSRWRAEQDAAKVALDGLHIRPLDAAKGKRRAKRDAKRKRDEMT